MTTDGPPRFESGDGNGSPDSEANNFETAPNAPSDHTPPIWGLTDEPEESSSYEPAGRTGAPELASADLPSTPGDSMSGPGHGDFVSSREASVDSDRMDLFDGLAVLVRRWYVVLPLVLITAYTAYVTYQDRSVSYQTSVVVGVAAQSVTTQSPAGADGSITATTNGLINNGGTNLLSNLLLIALNDPAVGTEISPDESVTYSVSLAERSVGQSDLPVVFLEASGPTAQSASDALEALQDLAQPTLSTIQINAGVPDDRLATVYSVRQPSTPVAVVEGRARAAVTVAVVGAVVSMVAAAMFEAVSHRRGLRARRRSSVHVAAR